MKPLEKVNEFALLKRLDKQHLKDLAEWQLPPVSPLHAAAVAKEAVRPTKVVRNSRDEGASFRELDKWDLRFLRVVDEVCSWSKDPSVKVGALLVSPDKRKFSPGYNGFPAGVDDDDERLNGPERVPMTAHAELNAILNSGTDLTGWTLYVTRPACVECAKAIIQARVARVVSPPLPEDSSWVASCDMGLKMMLEAGLTVDFLRGGA
jgi:dCMP deaminase